MKVFIAATALFIFVEVVYSVPLETGEGGHWYLALFPGHMTTWPGN